MPGPVALAAGFFVAEQVINFGLRYYDSQKPDPLEALQDGVDSNGRKLDEITRKLDELDDALGDLSADLMAEFKVTQDLIPTVAINDAVGEARGARGALNRLNTLDNPSSGRIEDVIRQSETALFKIIEQADTRLQTATPESALGFVGALTYAAGIRLQLAMQYEDGALGSQSIKEAFEDLADVLMQIEAVAMPLLREEVSLSTALTSVIPDGDRATAVYTVTGESDVTGDTEAEIVPFPVSFRSLPDANEALRQKAERAFGDRVIESVALSDYDTLGFDDLRDMAEAFAEMSDGIQRIGSGRDDSLTGTDGNDFLVGKAGDDVLRGHADEDVLRGGQGRDKMFGGDGHDNLLGNQGRDLMRGGAGNDQFKGGKGNDRIEGQRGSDNASGGRGEDLIWGGKGSDILEGGRGMDALFGGDGRDYLFGGDGKDRLVGGDGADNFVFDARLKSGPDRIVDFSDADQIALENNIFRGLMTGSLGERRFDTDFRPETDKASILYVDSKLYFDRDGNGSADPIHFATLVGAPDLEAADIFVF